MKLLSLFFVVASSLSLVIAGDGGVRRLCWLFEDRVNFVSVRDGCWHRSRQMFGHRQRLFEAESSLFENQKHPKPR
jgi:hypothetical protein